MKTSPKQRRAILLALQHVIPEEREMILQSILENLCTSCSRITEDSMEPCPDCCECAECMD